MSSSPTVDVSRSRFRRAIRREGFFRLVSRKVRHSWNTRFHARLCIWQWKKSDPLPEPGGDFRIGRYESLIEVPDYAMNELIAEEGIEIGTRFLEDFAEGSVLWLALDGNRVAGYHWTARGDRVDDWHLPMDEKDALVFATVTLFDYRRRGVARALMRAICEQEVAEGGSAYSDCMFWNKPAVNCFRSAGFEQVALRKPLANHPD